MKLAIAVRVMSSDLNPDEVTTSIGIQPTTAYRNGDVFYAPSGEKRGNRRLGLWMYEEKIENIEILENAIKYFLQAFDGKDDLFQSFAKKNIKMDLFIGVFDGASVANITLSPCMMRKISDLSLIMDCSFYD